MIRPKIHPPGHVPGPMAQMAEEIGATVMRLDGPPTFPYKPHYQNMLEALAECGSIAEACRETGVDYHEVGNERGLKPELDWWIEQALARYEDKLRTRLHAAAFGTGDFAGMEAREQAKIALGLLRELALDTQRRARARERREAREEEKRAMQAGPQVIVLDNIPRARRPQALPQGDEE